MALHIILTILFICVFTCLDYYSLCLSLSLHVFIFSGCLALPKLNLQFLTLHDYLLRNFNLFRLESTYEIRQDIEDVVWRMKPWWEVSESVRLQETWSRTSQKTHLSNTYSAHVQWISRGGFWFIILLKLNTFLIFISAQGRKSPLPCLSLPRWYGTTIIFY